MLGFRWALSTPNEEHLTNPSGFAAINVWEDDDNLYAEAELPGFDSEHLEIFVTSDNQLSIRGERYPIEQVGKWHRRERRYGRFERQVVLPAAVDADKVDARLQNGVLQVVLPKSEKQRTHRIVVNAG